MTKAKKKAIKKLRKAADKMAVAGNQFNFPGTFIHAEAFWAASDALRDIADVFFDETELDDWI